jgi:hypothetical protein
MRVVLTLTASSADLRNLTVRVASVRRSSKFEFCHCVTISLSDQQSLEKGSSAMAMSVAQTVPDIYLHPRFYTQTTRHRNFKILAHRFNHSNLYG